MSEKEINQFKVDFFDFEKSILEKLLEDKSSKKNIIWGTNNYSRHGKGHSAKDPVLFSLLKKRTGWIIKPRIFKSISQQKARSKDMAEVFTPSWVCNMQNNLVDEQWFGYENPFNVAQNHEWKTVGKVLFKGEKKWQAYISDTRMEITCGEAPYLVSRYDTVSGEYIEVKDRIGLLDRKLRVISENVEKEEEWLNYAKIACQNIYGFDFQGDNVFIARVNVLSTIDEFFKDKFNKKLDTKELMDFADIIVWNIFQMDGLKYVIPFSCHMEKEVQGTLFGEDPEPVFCEGCKTGNNKNHNGKYVRIKDWNKNKTIRFIDLGGGRL